MWKNKKVSVIFPTYNEKESMYDSIQDFFASGYVDEVLVVNNNAAPGTDEEVLKTKARLVHENIQGYGSAIRRGFEEVTGDLIIISEPDGTFVGNDVLKLLAYSEDFSVVFGTRTSRGLILQGANMGVFLKWGNVFVAKMVEVLFQTSWQLTDVGCTMRIIKREHLNKVKDKFTVGGSHFGIEMMLICIASGLKCVEIPVTYRQRVGESSVTGSFWKALFLGLTMIVWVINFRVKTLIKNQYKIK